MYDINDELREMDRRIRRDAEGEDLDRFLGSDEGSEEGVGEADVLMRHRLTRHLWLMCTMKEQYGMPRMEESLTGRIVDAWGVG